MSKILCIPDFHQDLPFVRNILDKELSKVDKVVFLGDAFDSFEPKNTAKEVCLYLEDLRSNLKEKFVFLVSNHDINYYYHYHAAKTFRHFDLNSRFYSSGSSKNKAKDIAKNLSEDFILNSKLAHLEDNVLYTHAGARPELFKYINEKFDVGGFLKEAKELWENWNWKANQNHQFFNIGPCRGGRDLFGGLTWCDFNHEHVDNPKDLPTQVCGHSGLTKPKNKGSLYCIDCRQSYYAIIDDGEVIYKEI